MSDTPNPVDGRFESDALDKLIQTAWDRFVGHGDKVKGEHPDAAREVTASADVSQEAGA